MARLTATTVNGVTKVKAKPELEWKLQAAAVQALRAHPEYEKRFALAGDMNAGRRKARAVAEAKATGMTPGEPDLRLYTDAGLVLIEYKSGTSVTKVQRERHVLLRSLGFDVHVVKTKTQSECVAATLKILNAKLGLTKLH